MLTRTCTLVLLGVALSSVGCWVETTPPRVVHVEHEHHVRPEDNDDHHEERHEEHHEHEHGEHEHHD